MKQIQLGLLFFIFALLVLVTGCTQASESETDSAVAEELYNNNLVYILHIQEALYDDPL